MALMILDPDLEKSLLAKRKRCDGQQYDEVWDGVYVIAPLPANEHQRFVSELVYILEETVGRAGLGEVFPGVNLSDRGKGWEKDFREPDVAVFLSDTKAINHGTHWQGAADFLVEIPSPGERAQEKVPFYGQLGVLELLVIDRGSRSPTRAADWSLELYRQQEGQLTMVGRATLAASQALVSQTVGLTFDLLPGEPRPEIQVSHPASGRQWRF